MKYLHFLLILAAFGFAMFALAKTRLEITDRVRFIAAALAAYFCDLLIQAMRFLAVLALGAFLLTGCATQKPVIKTDSPVAVAGQSLNDAAQKALTAYAEYKEGDKDILWSLQTMFYAYRDSKPLVADVKALVASWTGSKGKPLAERLGILFGTSTGTPEEKMTALAQAATQAAAKP